MLIKVLIFSVLYILTFVGIISDNVTIVVVSFVIFWVYMGYEISYSHGMIINEKDIEARKEFIWNILSAFIYFLSFFMAITIGEPMSGSDFLDAMIFHVLFGGMGALMGRSGGKKRRKIRIQEKIINDKNVVEKLMASTEKYNTQITGWKDYINSQNAIIDNEERYLRLVDLFNLIKEETIIGEELRNNVDAIKSQIVNANYEIKRLETEIESNQKQINELNMSIREFENILFAG